MKKKLLFVSFVFFQYVMLAQEHAWVYFTDKEDVANSIANPLTILTQKAIDRKTKHNIAIDSRDVPVNENYISQIKNTNGGEDSQFQMLKNLEKCENVEKVWKNVESCGKTWKKVEK